MFQFEDGRFFLVEDNSTRHKHALTNKPSELPAQFSSALIPRKQYPSLNSAPTSCIFESHHPTSGL